MTGDQASPEHRDKNEGGDGRGRVAFPFFAEPAFQRNPLLAHLYIVERDFHLAGLAEGALATSQCNSPNRFRATRDDDVLPEPDGASDTKGEGIASADLPAF